MNPILNDPLVRRYFGCTEHGPDKNSYHFDRCDQTVALRVLDAMTTKINKGDRYLSLSARARSAEYMAYENWDGMWHPNALRLPSEHQEPDYEKELAEQRKLCVGWPSDNSVSKLVDLARKAERQKMEKERQGEAKR